LRGLSACLSFFTLVPPARSTLFPYTTLFRSLGNMPPFHATNQYLQPGYEGPLNHRVMTIAEVLRGEGYRTYMVGKWHLGALPGFRPEDRGFDRVFSFLGGGVSHFDDHRALSSAELPRTRHDEGAADLTESLPHGF